MIEWKQIPYRMPGVKGTKIGLMVYTIFTPQVHDAVDYELTWGAQESFIGNFNTIEEANDAVREHFTRHALSGLKELYK